MDPERRYAAASVEKQIEEWRAYLRRSRAITGRDTAELEDHLREQMASLGDQGLSDDEAFLVAVKRMGAIDALTREFAREHSDRLWKQLVLSGDRSEADADSPATRGSHRMWVAVALAVAAAVAIKIPALFGIPFDPDDPRGGAFYGLNIAFFTLPFIAAYFAWERPLPRSSRFWLAAAFGAAAAVVNALPFPTLRSHTQVLTVIHLPIALWLAGGVAYVGGRLLGSERRMDLNRFTGEPVIYYVRSALGGVVLSGLTFTLFQAIGINVQSQVHSWIVPCGIAGATVTATWLVEAKQSVIENMAPVLTRLFTTLFTLVLLVFLTTMAWTGRPIDIQRNVLIAFDLLLVLVVGLVLYSASARDPEAPPNLFDGLQLLLVASALPACAGRIAPLAGVPATWRRVPFANSTSADRMDVSLTKRMW